MKPMNESPVWIRFPDLASLPTRSHHENWRILSTMPSRRAFKRTKAMKGSVDNYKVKGNKKPKWRFRIYVGKNAAGIKQYEQKAGFPRESDAYDAMRRRIAEIEEREGKLAPTTETFGDYLRRW